METNEDFLAELFYEYVDYEKRSYPEEISVSTFESIYDDDDDDLAKFVSNDSLVAYHFVDTRGKLVKWLVKLEGKCFKFIEDRGLSADAIMMFMETEEVKSLINSHSVISEETISLNDYYDALLRADWFYSYSECHETRSRAVKSIELLRLIGDSHPVARKLWSDCQKYVGELWSNPNAPAFYCPNINMRFTYKVRK